jgi:Ca-activated chloride channel family protein
MQPILVTVLVLAAVVGVVLLLGSRRRAPAARGRTGTGGRPSASPARRRRAPAKQRSAFQKAPLALRVLPILLLIGAVVALVIALAQFRVSKTAKSPIVVLVLDASLSMNATDVKPNRLAAAQQAADTFVAQLPESFRVGLVTFADKPTVLVVPTIDHTKVDGALRNPPRSRGTVIGDGLDAGLTAIQDQWNAGGSTSAAVVLLSDGQDTGSDIAPLDAATRSSGLGIPVYTVVLGKTSGRGAADDELLSQIAQTTGATTVTAASAEELNAIYQNLGTQLSTQLKISSSAQLFVIIAVALAMGAAVIVLILNQRRPY